MGALKPGGGSGGPVTIASIADASVSGAAVLGGTPAQGRTALSVGGTATSGHCYDRPAAATAGADGRFRDTDTGVQYVSDGTLWLASLGSGAVTDKAALKVLGGNIIAPTQDLSAYTVDNITVGCLWYWDGPVGGAANVLFQLGTDAAGIAVYLIASGGNILLRAITASTAVTLKTYSPASALAVGLHALSVAAISGNNWRFSVDGDPVADVAMGATYVAPGSSVGMAIGNNTIPNGPLVGRICDVPVWHSLLSSADMAALSTLPGTPTYRLPISSGMGAPAIRAEANRYDLVTPAHLVAAGLTRALDVSSGVRKSTF